MALNMGILKGAVENVNTPSYERTVQSGAVSVDPTKAVTQGVEKNGASEKTGDSECRTCSERKYMDGSNEGDVSFKSPTHISPENSASAVMSHEQEHVANAREEGGKEGARLISASVTLKLSVCPECGRSYVAGGTTRTQIAYTKDDPYSQAKKELEGDALSGANVDKAV